MLVVSLKSLIEPTDREEIDRIARDVVLDTYRSARARATAEQASFDAALEAYQRNFPHIPGTLAKQAVACIIDGCSA